MSDDVLDVRKYDPKIIELLEIICAFFVSKIYNSIYQSARIAYQRDNRDGHSIYEVLENYVLMYVDSLNMEAGIAQEINDMYKFYTKNTQKFISMEQFVLEVSGLFLPHHTKDPQRTKVVIKAIRNIVPKSYAIVVTNYLTHIHNDRANKDVQRKIQDEFMRHALMYRFAEHERITKNKLSPDHMVNDKLIGNMAAVINAQKEKIKANEEERSRLRSTIIMQHNIIKGLQQELAELRAAASASVPALQDDPSPILEEAGEGTSEVFVLD